MTTTMFTNREFAIAIWLGIGALWLLPKPGIRRSMKGLLGIIFGKKIFPLLLILIAYVILIVWAAVRVQLWDWSMLKETIYWFFGTAFVMFANINSAGSDKHFFRKKAFGSIGFAVFLEFVINLYTFSLPVELILIPFILLLVGMITVAEIDPKYAETKKVLDFIFAALGIGLLLYALTMTIRNLDGFFTLTTLKDFLLHPILTIALLPIIYCFALFSVYESLFRRLEVAIEKKSAEAVTFLKKRIIAICHLNLGKLNTLSRAIAPHMWSVTNKNEAAAMINHYLNGTLLD